MNDQYVGIEGSTCNAQAWTPPVKLNVLPNRGRVGLIDRVVPGVSDFEMRITVPENLSQPLQLKKFKASGFTTKIRQ